MGTKSRSTAAAAGDSELLERGAKVGYGANGLVHLLIAWLALQVAWGGSAGQEADQTGALQSLAGTPMGSALLWVVVVGFALLGLWNVTEAVGRHDTKERVKAGAKAVVYATLAATALSVVQGSSSSGSQQTSGFTARLMANPAGQALVVLVGLGVLGVAVHHVVKGWRETFLDDLDEHPGPAVVRLGRIGYIAKGAALGIVGGLFVAAAVNRDPERAQGLDGALRALLELPLGKLLLTLVALGLAAYGIYSFARARHARV